MQPIGCRLSPHTRDCSLCSQTATRSSGLPFNGLLSSLSQKKTRVAAEQTMLLVTSYFVGCNGLVVVRLPAAREDPDSNRAADKSLCFHENHCDVQLWARDAHLLQCLGRLSVPSSEGR